MRSACIIFLLACSLSVYSQRSNDKAEDVPYFFSCDESEAYADDWKSFLKQILQGPLDSIVEAGNIPGGSYRVKFQFIIDAKGKLSDFVAVNDTFGLGKVVVNAAKRYHKRWKPATQGGRAVKSYHMQAVTFEITGDEEEEEPFWAAMGVMKLGKPLNKNNTGCCQQIVHIDQRTYTPDDNGMPAALNKESRKLDHGGIEIPARVDKEEWQTYIQRAMDSALTNFDKITPGTYIATVNYAIGKDGRIDTVIIAQDPGFEIAQHFKRVIEKFPGRWTPATRNGRAIKWFQRQSFSYEISVVETIPCDPAQQSTNY
jgi:hypothetical protein